MSSNFDTIALHFFLGGKIKIKRKIMKITLIVAKSKNNAIGKNNALLWRLSADLKNFKRLTSGHCIIMGRKTYESIGKPLPNRTNIIITRNKDFEAAGCLIQHSLDSALDSARNSEEKEVFIIGGAQIYQQALDRVDKIYLTQVDTEIEGDTFFPVLDSKKWKCTQKEEYFADQKNEYNYAFEIYQRV